MKVKLKLPTGAKEQQQVKEGSNEWKSYETTRTDLRPGTAKGKFEMRVFLTDGRQKKLVVTASVKYFNDLEGEERRREKKYPLD